MPPRPHSTLPIDDTSAYPSDSATAVADDVEEFGRSAIHDPLALEKQEPRREGLRDS